MNNLCFAATIQQEYADIICKEAMSLGVPKENIVLGQKECNFLQIGISIKFNNDEAYKKFNAWDIPGIVEKV